MTMRSMATARWATMMDGDGLTGDDNNDGNDDDDDNVDGAMGDGATGYDDNNDGDGQR